MYNKSSTSLALISVLSILIVLFIAVSNVENAPIRRPFPTQGANNAGVSGGAENAFQAYNQDEALQAPDFDTNFPEFVNKVEEAEIGPTDAIGEGTTLEIEFGNNNVLPLPAEIDVPTVRETKQVKADSAAEDKDFLTKGINSELLDKVGFKNFFIKPRPFDGLIFETFDASMLSYLNVLDRKVIQLIDGNEVEVLRVYEFNLNDADAAAEVYSYLKISLKDQLGVSVNETNQFGLSSFYVNFQAPSDSAFLVVKTKGNVYALSYPKAENQETNYFNLVSDLLTELI
jgi:hypothetical protein